MRNHQANTAPLQPTPSALPLKAWDHLSPENKNRAEEIARQFNPRDLFALSTYGMALQANLNKVTDPILQRIRVIDSGLAGELLEELERATNRLDPRSLKPGAFHLPLIREFFNAGKHFIKQYERISSKLEEVKTSLEAEGRNLVDDINALERLYTENEKFYQELLIFRAAGELKIESLKKEAVDLHNKAKLHTNDLFDRNAIVELDNIIQRFEGRLYDLQLTITSSIQAAAQIRFLQNGDRALVELIQRDILTVIPTWKMHMTTAILFSRQQKILDRQIAITNATNRLLESSTALIQSGQRKLVEESVRGIVDFETLQNTHAMLINTVRETRRIYEEERQKRLENEKHLGELSAELRDTFSHFPTSN